MISNEYNYRLIFVTSEVVKLRKCKHILYCDVHRKFHLRNYYTQYFNGTLIITTVGFHTYFGGWSKTSTLMMEAGPVSESLVSITELKPLITQEDLMVT